MVNIEIKDHSTDVPGIAGKIVGPGGSAGTQRSVVISSFDHFQLLEVRRLDETLLTGVLDQRPACASGRLPEAARRRFVQPGLL